MLQYYNIATLLTCNTFITIVYIQLLPEYFLATQLISVNNHFFVKMARVGYVFRNLLTSAFSIIPFDIRINEFSL